MKSALPVVLLFSLMGVGCGREQLSSLREDFVVEQTRIDLGRVWVGHAQDVRIPVENRARYALVLEVEGEPLNVPAAGVTELVVAVEPTEAGPFERRVRIAGELQSVEVIISGGAAIVPQCAARHGCVTSAFDFEAGACVESQLPEETSCGGGSSCVIEGRCKAGECRGEAVSCDDGNACTDDACSVGQGCVHLDSSSRCEPTDGADPCAAGYCDPQSGCQSAVVPDGTSCGASNCSVANVCISGLCEERAVPEGAACGSASACQGRGQCTQGSCVQAPPSVLPAAWSYSPPGDGKVRSALGIDDQGALLFVECDVSCALVSLSPAGALRYRAAMTGVTSARTFALGRGRAFVSTDDGLLVIHHAATGARIAAVNTLSLVQAELLPMSGGGSNTRAEVSNLAVDGAGRIFLLLRVYSTSGDTIANRGGFLLALDDATGALLWKRRAGSFLRLVVNEAGHVFSTEWSATSSNAARLVSWDAQGVERFSVTGTDAPVAAHAGKLLTQYGVVRSSTGATVGSNPSGPRGGSDAILMRNDSLWATENMDCFPAEPALNRMDVLTGALTFRTVLDTSLYSYPVSAPLLTQGDGVLLMLSTHSAPGVNQNRLMEVDALGAITMSCELGAAESPAGGLLGSERYFVIDQEANASSPSARRTVIRAYDVPGKLPASTGWVGPAGGPQLSSRPR